VSSILITDHGFKSVEIERGIIEDAGFHLLTAQCRRPEDVIAAAGDAEALLVQWAPIDHTVFAALPKLRVVVRYGVGVDNVDLAAARARGVKVCNVPDYCIDEVADHSLALALALARQLPQTHARTLAGEWKIVPPSSLPSFAEMTFACAGFGRIARAVLTRAGGFGFRLAAYDPYVDAGAFASAGIRRLNLEELRAEADILSLHLPLVEQTRRFIDAAALTQMKRSALLINTSRGGLVDTVALATALRRGDLAGAGLDVYELEPLPTDHPLRHAPNTILTSHTAWYSEASGTRLQQLAAVEAVRGVRGEPLRHVLN
jgi:D-3-phosphoglycerate dehydrogenase / 2-oxoglutarate reductase